VAHFEKGLEATVAYIWKEILCNDIRVELYHFKDAEGNLKADLTLKAAYAKMTFRWKTLANDPVTGKRA